MTNSFYRVVDEWATPNLAVVPLAKGKPIGTRHLDLWGKVPTESRKSLFDADFRDKGGDGAALLTTGPKLRICFVDVDDPVKLDSVRRFLREKTGATYFVEVTTGRGAHIYFKMEDHQTYTSGKALKWGEFTKPNGDVAACVDLRGEGSTAIMPGSIYDKTDKGGIRTTYRWGGRFGHLDFEFPPFEEFAAALPVLTKALWDEMAGPKSSAGAGEAVEVDWSSDPLWSKINPNHRGNQICPMCGHETLKRSKIPGAMACFHDDCRGDAPARIYKPIDRTKKALEKEVEEYEARQAGTALVEPNREQLGSTNARLPESPEDMAWLGFRADVLAELGPPPQDPDEILWGYDFAEEDPCHGLGLQARRAEDLSGGRWDWATITRCTSSTTVTQARWSPNKMKGSAKRFIPSCWAYSCPTCGPLLLKALANALRAWAWFQVGAPREPNCSLLGSRGAWYYSLATSSSFGHSDPLRHVLKRHAAKHPNDFHWLGLASTPTETQLLIFWRRGACPKEGTALWDLFDDLNPVLGDQDAILSQALSAIDLEAWQRARIAGAESRIVLLLGPSQMLEEVKALQDWLTTHNRKPYRQPMLKRWEELRANFVEEAPEEVESPKTSLKREHRQLLALLRKREKDLLKLEREALKAEQEREKAELAAKRSLAKEELEKTCINRSLKNAAPYFKAIRDALQDSKISDMDTGPLPLNAAELLKQCIEDGRVEECTPGHRKAGRIKVEEDALPSPATKAKAALVEELLDFN